MRDGAEQPGLRSVLPEFPVCVCGGKARAKLITKKPVEAAAGEQAENRRARSAKLRILEKL